MLLLNPTILTTAAIFGTIVLMCVSCVFIVSRLRHDNSLMDIFYGPIFALSYWITWWLTDAPPGTPVMVGVLVTLWAVRLGVRIARKNWGQPEDARYAAWREAWCQHGQLYFIARSYVQVNLLQGVIIFLVATPLWWIIALKSLTNNWLLVIGVLIMLIGLIYETTADWQLDRFIAEKKAANTKRPLLTSGLFRYSRRPNYFGEALIWWGFALLALSSSWGSWPVLIGPLVITYILYKVTGPMLEAQFLEKYPDAYQTYIKKTSNFIVPNFRQRINE